MMDNSRRLIAEADFELSHPDRKMWARIYAPTLAPDGETWACAYTIDAPLSVEQSGRGETSLLALVEAFRGMSRALYGSAEYRDGQIGVDGEFAANLFMPATADMLDIAPYPF